MPISSTGAQGFVSSKYGVIGINTVVVNSTPANFGRVQLRQRKPLSMMELSVEHLYATTHIKHL